MIWSQSTCSYRTALKQTDFHLRVDLQFWRHLRSFLAWAHHRCSHHSLLGWDYSFHQVGYELWLMFSDRPSRVCSDLTSLVALSRLNWRYCNWGFRDRCSGPSAFLDYHYCKYSLRKAEKQENHTCEQNSSLGYDQKITFRSTLIKNQSLRTSLSYPNCSPVSDDSHGALRSNLKLIIIAG